MKFIRKKGVKKLTITHNKKVLLWIIGLLILLIFLIIFIVQENKKVVDVVKRDLCYSDNNCAPATSCHATECVIKEKAVENKDVICSAVCLSKLDCGAGSCGCVNNQCEIIPQIK